MFIEIYDAVSSEHLDNNIFFEGQTYDILVGEEGIYGFIVNVTVIVPWATYQTTEELPYVEIVAPNLTDYESFSIRAVKGNASATVEITIMKGSLYIIADPATVEEKKEFQVTVRDQNHQPIAGAYVYTTANATPVLTNIQGLADLTAPEVTSSDTILIQVIKNGYVPGSTNIYVENAGAFTFALPNEIIVQILPILFAVIAVVFAVGFVRWRQKKNSPNIQTATKLKKTQKGTKGIETKKSRHFEKEPSLFPDYEPTNVSISTPDPRVEEIRIPFQDKQKGTTVVSHERTSEQSSQPNRKKEDEWFKGENYMRYRLDELTGKIDEKTDGRWFEGERDSKYKVHETLKKSSKKKKDDDEENK